MCGLIWEPNPSRSRPFESSCTSFAMVAVIMGLRANATTMPVPSSSVEVAVAAPATIRSGSCPVSADQAPS